MSLIIIGDVGTCSICGKKATGLLDTTQGSMGKFIDWLHNDATPLCNNN